LKSTGKWKDVPFEKFFLNYGSMKKQTEEEIHRNLEMVKMALKAKHGT
jgi:hypothetical protein